MSDERRKTKIVDAWCQDCGEHQKAAVYVDREPYQLLEGLEVCPMCSGSMGLKEPDLAAYAVE